MTALEFVLAEANEIVFPFPLNVTVFVSEAPGIACITNCSL